MSVTFQTERFADIWGEVQPLLARHWDEVAAKDITGSLDVDEALYLSMDKADLLHITTARDEGVLVGYAAYLIYRNHHYRRKLIADADVFFLLPECRKGLLGLHLLRAAESVMRERGVNVIVQKVKASHDCGALFRRMGYRLTEYLYMKAV
ncbi:hypothetical protein HMPREF0326_02269 [Desulfovibrio sp. 3_1_syn3]|uniref:GNAT family N-acetyltransferase n=1 Tax=Desulfovibrio sp. 3_1_syn3 TaxID=457398 RepID=UPI0001E12C04|nr:GNAT family N-acetyltransferase [Desulfovibrio sp. 3_1_syn3]EFL84940.1 hypothetical protein HMPREF0326_02269 [Desulfovibrio sp. 3_1_syn3]